MSTTRKLCTAVCAAAAVATLAPVGAAAVTIPGVPPGTIPPEVEAAIPPEVSAALGDSLANVFTNLAGLDLTGLGIATAGSAPGHSTAAAIDLPGFLTLGKTMTTKDSSKVEVLSVGGENLLTKEGDAGGGHNTGGLASIGDAVDGLNKSMCPSGVTPPSSCTMLLYSAASDASTSGSSSKTTGSITTTTTTNSDTHKANFKLAKVQLEGTPHGIEILPTSATSVKTSGTIVVKRGSITLSTIPFGPLCTDVATAFIATGSGSVALVSLVGINNAIKVGGILKPC